MKSYALPFAITGALLIAALLAVTNLITSPGVLWFVCALPLLAGWPLGVFFLKNKQYTAFSLSYSLLVIALLAALNWVITPHTLWFIYAAPIALLWPACMLLKDKMLKLPAALLLGIFITVYCVLVNVWLTPGRVWAIHPIFAAMWWPLSLYFTGKGYFKAFSVMGALMTIFYLIGCNLLSTPYPWALYACFPVIWWPLAMFLGKRLGAIKFSLLGSICTLLWYGALNLFLAPGSPWILFIAFALIWWPLSVYFFGKQRPDIYAVIMSIISIVFFTAVNLIYSPGAVWAIYPAFAIAWWPLSVIFYNRRRPDIYAVIMALISISFFAAVNLLTSPSVIWAIYPAFALLWWPLTLILHGWSRPDIYAVVMSLISIAFFIAVNLITSPGFLWSVFPSLGILWWPLAMVFRGRHKPFGFSLAGAVLSIGTLVTVNLITSSGFLWSIFPSLGMLWWPAVVFFSKRKSPLGFSLAGSLLVIALTASVNLITSPGFLWCVFPAFLVLWWPAAMLFSRAGKRRLAETKA